MLTTRPPAQPIATHQPTKPTTMASTEVIFKDDHNVPIATATTTDQRVVAPVVYKATGSTQSDFLQSPKSGGSQSFYYSASHTSSDSTYGSPPENVSPTKLFPKVPQSPLKKSPTKRITSRLELSETPIPPRMSVSAASYKRNAQSKQASEPPPMPTIRSRVSETALSDAYNGGRDSRFRSGTNHVRFPSNTSTRLEFIPDQDERCTRADHDMLDRKLTILENKLETIVPALTALTKALTGLTAKIEDDSIMKKLSNALQQTRGPELNVHSPTSAIPYGLPTPASEEIFRLNSFVSDRAGDRPMFGSVSDRGTIRGDGSRTHSRRGSKPVRAIIEELNQQDSLTELEGPRSEIARPWGARSRQQSCFEPDTESEVDELELPNGQLSPTRPVVKATRQFKSVNSFPMKLQHKQSFSHSRNNSLLTLPKAAPGKLAARTNVPPPVKIPLYESDITAVAGDVPSSNESAQNSPPKRAVSPNEHISPTTTLSAYTEHQVAFREKAPLPPLPQTAGLQRSHSHLIAPKVTAYSVPTTPTRLIPSPAPTQPLVIRPAARSPPQQPGPMQHERPVQSSPQPLVNHAVHSNQPVPSTQAFQGVSPAHPNCAECLAASNPSHNLPAPPPAQPAWYFLYGQLTDPTFLAELLHLPHPPALQPARVHTHTLKYFGPFPCAVPITAMRESAIGPRDENRDAVEGMAWYVGSAEMAEWLRRHEDEAFVEVACEIEFVGAAGAGEGMRLVDDTVGAAGVVGRMFEWRGAEDKLLTAPAI